MSENKKAKMKLYVWVDPLASVELQRAAVPEPKQEWTAEYLWDCFGFFSSLQVVAKKIAESHNAALAEERELLAIALQNLHNAEEMLATERAAAAKAVEGLKEALVPIAALKICDDREPFTELSPDLLTGFREAHDLILSALAFYEQREQTK